MKHATWPRPCYGPPSLFPRSEFRVKAEGGALPTVNNSLSSLLATWCLGPLRRCSARRVCRMSRIEVRPTGGLRWSSRWASHRWCSTHPTGLSFPMHLVSLGTTVVFGS
jgi:hypothetical protein